MMLASPYDGRPLPRLWWVSDKKDGIHFIWHRRHGMLSKQKKQMKYIPQWWVDRHLSKHGLDCLEGELFSENLTHQGIVSAVKSGTMIGILPCLFDAPPPGLISYWWDGMILPFARMPYHERYAEIPVDYRIPQSRVGDSSIADLMAGRREGVIVRDPFALYEIKRVRTMLKIKHKLDDTCVITGFSPGAGKYEGLLGALIVTWNNVTFKLSGMEDAQRVPGYYRVGQHIRFEYASLTDGGVPREARIAE